MSHSYTASRTHLDSFIPGYSTGDYITPKSSDGTRVIFRIIGLVPPKGHSGIYYGTVDPETDLLMEVKMVRDKRRYAGDTLDTNEFNGLIRNAGYWDWSNDQETDFIILSKLLEGYRPCSASEKVLYTHE